MASELEQMCRTLTAIDGELNQMAAELARRAGSIDQATRQAGAIRGSADAVGAGLTHTMGALTAAAQACKVAAQMLHQCSKKGQAYVSRTVGARGVTPTSRGDPPASGGGTVDGGVTLLTSPLQAIYDNCSFAAQHSAGRFFLDSDDPFRSVAESMPPVTNGSYLTMIHGNATSVGVGAQSLTAAELADLIRYDPSYRPGQPVTLFSCSTGAADGGFAQQLADELDTRVTAPTAPAWLPPDADGTILITPSDPATGMPIVDHRGRGLGRWRVFEPRRGPAPGTSK